MRADAVKLQIGDVEVTVAGNVVAWTSGMEVDADGSPRAYAPIASGLPTLDFLGNAGSGTHWPGLVCNAAGVPYVQQAGDPRPGYYVSSTALIDPRYRQRDPRRYLDPEAVPYVSIPPELESYGARVGDLCLISYNALRVGAIVGDVGPRKKIGEGSVLLCQILGVNPFRAMPRHHLVGIDAGVSFQLFMKSRSDPAWPRSDLQTAALALAVVQG